MPLQIGKTYNLGGNIGKVKIEKATAKGKAKSAVQLSTGKRINFGDPGMPNAPDDEERQGNYCSRSKSLNKRGFNANTLSREDWNCKDSTMIESIFFDDGSRWVTTKSKRKIKLSETGEILAGMGGKFNGRNISDINKEPEKESEKEPEAKEKSKTQQKKQQGKKKKGKAAKREKNKKKAAKQKEKETASGQGRLFDSAIIESVLLI